MATDHSGNGNPGTLVNMDSTTDWIAGKIDNCLEFDGAFLDKKLEFFVELFQMQLDFRTRQEFFFRKGFGQIIIGACLKSGD